MRRIVECGLAFCLFSLAVIAQTRSDSLAAIKPPIGHPLQSIENASLNPGKQNFFQTFLMDESAIWTSPFHLDQHEALIWGGVAATTAIAFTFDESISTDAVRFEKEHVWAQTISPIATQFGQFYVPYGIAALYCLDGMALNDNTRTDTGILAVQAMVHSGIVVQVLKHVFGRSRPFVHKEEDNWDGPRVILVRYYRGGFSPYDSFPSGHTITAFSLATVIAEREEPWVGVVAYSCAGLCGASRVTQNDHWLSDVIVGGALGVAIGNFEVNTHQERYGISPIIGARSAGVSIQFN